MKHRRREPSSGVSSFRSNDSRAMRGRIPKIPNFPIRNKRNEEQAASPSETILPPQSASASAFQHVVPAASTSQGKRTFDRIRRSPSYYGFDNSSPYSTITVPPKRPRRAEDVKNSQLPPASVVETVQTIATQKPEQTNISPVIGEVSPPILAFASYLTSRSNLWMRTSGRCQYSMMRNERSMIELYADHKPVKTVELIV